MGLTSLSASGPKRRTLFLAGGIFILLTLAITTPCRSSGLLLVDKIPEGQAFGTVEDVAPGSKVLLKLSPGDSFQKGDRLELIHMAGMTPIDMGLFEVDSFKGELVVVKPVSMLVEPSQGMQVIASLHKPGSKDRRVLEYITGQDAPLVAGGADAASKMPQSNFQKSKIPDAIKDR